jgi:autotransporter strand-loop-strand O-heptosyltransferase
MEYNQLDKIKQSGKLGVIYFNGLSELEKCKEISNKFIESEIDILCISNLDFDNYFNFDFFIKQLTDKELLDFCIDNSYNRLVFSVEDSFSEINILNTDLKEFSFQKHKILNPEEDYQILIGFIRGARVEILGKSKRKFKVSFFDKSTGKIEYQNYLSVNNWCTSYKSYFVDWLIRVEDVETGEILKEESIDLSNKNVLISFDSSSLGDSIAWIAGVEEFRKKWNCNIFLSTFKNHLFELEYPSINFMNPGSAIANIYSQYNIGWYYTSDGAIDLNRTPVDPKTRPLQATSYDILGVEYNAEKSKVKKSNLPKLIEGDYVCIAPHSTAQSKYWNNPSGWNELIDYFTSKGLEVICVSREGSDYMGNSFPNTIRYIDSSAPFDELMSYIQNSKLFIGLSSGISWLSWAIGVPTTIISGFSDPLTEPTDNNIIRIFNPSVCNSCFNRVRLDPSDWNWCPDKKGTEEQFICSKSITSNQVIQKIEDWFFNNKIKLYREVENVTLTKELSVLKSIISNNNYKIGYTNLKDNLLKSYLFENISISESEKPDVFLFEGPVSIGYHVYKNALNEGGCLIFWNIEDSDFWKSLQGEKIEILNTQTNKKIGVIYK